jgi:hypothetical protein
MTFSQGKRFHHVGLVSLLQGCCTNKSNNATIIIIIIIIKRERERERESEKDDTKGVRSDHETETVVLRLQ